VSLDDIARRRLAIAQAKAARQAQHVADGIREREAARLAAAVTCETPEQLLASLRASLEVTEDEGNPSPTDGAA